MATLQEIQAAEYEMLEWLDKQCTRLGIRYCMVGGTMLGAVRHQGFIPWDDDIDLYFSLEDFEILKKHFQSDNFFLQTVETEREFYSLVYKLRKNGTEMKTDFNRMLHIHQGIWIDLFVYMDAGRTAFAKKLQVFFRNVLQSYRLRYYYKYTNPKRRVHVLLCGLPEKVSVALDHMLVAIIKSLGSKKSGEYIVFDVCPRIFFKKSFFDNTRRYRFEKGEFWGIDEYDEYLSDFYGPDYMTPKKWGHVPDYSEVKA